MTQATAVPYAITDPAYIPRERYLDRAFFELEKQKLWPHVWQMACTLEEIPRVGDFVEYWVADQSVIVVRTGPDEVKAYQNACRHRATQLAMGSGTFVGHQIVCPFHGWRWNLDGTASYLFGQPGFEERCLQPQDVRLVECKVGTWANFVFINMDPHAPPLHETLGPLPQLLDPLNVDKMRVRWWKAVRLKANWKLAVEAFMEAFHVMQTHPQLTVGEADQYPTENVDYHAYPGGHMHFQGKESDTVADAAELAGHDERDALITALRLLEEGSDALALAKDIHVIEGLRTTDYAPGEFQSTMVQAIATWNRGAGLPFPDPDPEAWSRWGGLFFAFPNFFLIPLFGNLVLHRARPDADDPEHCYFEFYSCTLVPEDQPTRRLRCDGVFAPDDPAWPLIPRQDFSNIERQQRGLHTQGFDAMRLATNYEKGIANLHTHIDAYLAR